MAFFLHIKVATRIQGMNMKYLLILLLALATSVSATLVPTTYNGLNDSGSELFTFTDFNSNFDDSAFSLLIEYGQFNTRDHEFGLYNYDRTNNLIGDMLAIFDSSSGAGSNSNVNWDINANTVTTMFGNINMLANREFGLYFKSDGDYFYSQAQFNPANFDAFGMYWQPNPNDIYNLYVYAQDNDSGDYHDYMYVGAGDVTQVPEPSTIALFGLVVLGFAVRRKFA